MHVVDASDADPEGQIAAVREVLNDIGAGGLPEVLVFNKADLADADALTTLRSTHPGAMIVSARTGVGLDELRAAVFAALPRPDVEMHALVPYGRGDLIDRIHKHGEFLATEHQAEGTRVVVRVHPELAGELEQFAIE